MGDWKQAALMVLFMAKLGFGAAIFMVLLQFFFALQDRIAELGSIFGLYLLIFAGTEIWVRSHLRKPAKDHHEYRARHRSKLRSTVQEISDTHKTWKRKLNEDKDGLFTFWVNDIQSQPTPLF